MKLVKVCLLGEASVGKTSLVRRFVDRSFSDAYLSTVGVTISRKRMSVQTTEEQAGLQLVLWDLEGGSRFDDMTSTYIRGARGAVIVGDMTRPATLDALHAHLDRFLGINPDGLAVAALNKSDLHHTPATAASPLQHPRLVAALPTSAKTGEGVDDLFQIIAAHLLEEGAHGPRA